MKNIDENLNTTLRNITQAKKVAIVLPTQLTNDSLCAGLALQGAISQAKNSQAGAASLFSASVSIPELPFLGILPQVHRALSNNTGLAIKVSNVHAQPGELRYEKIADGLVITINPSSGEFQDSDVSVLPNAINFDLVISIGAANLEQLGTIYTESTKLFFETPTINIDVDPNNEYFGTINLINTTATSLSELVMDIVEALPNGLTEPVATSLLAGIITQTSSFRDPKTTPVALQKSSRLVSKGAKQQEIIQHFFKTKPLPLLQLWGRALARIIAQPDKQTLTAVVTASDLEKTQAGVESLPIVLCDIIEMVTGYSVIIFLAELPRVGQETAKVQVLIAGLPHENLAEMAEQLGGSRMKSVPLVGKFDYISFSLPGNVADVQQNLTNLIQKRSSVT